MTKDLAALCLLTLVAGVARAAAPSAALVIGDGVTVEMLTAARVYKHGARGQLHLESFPHTAIVRTWSANNLVTDSAAAATALARGGKAANRAIGVVEGKPGAPSLLDHARAAGWSVAVVSDDSVTGATPGAFLAEQDSRDDHPGLAAKLLEQIPKRADVVLGGGRAWFKVTDGFTYPEKAGTQEQVLANQTALGTRADLRTFESWVEFSAALPGLPRDRPVLGLFADDVMPYAADGAKTPSLADLTAAAVRLLKARGKPFLIVVEAALPDKAAHQNQARRVLEEVLQLDDALAVLDKELPPDALIVATADHGTGGLALNGYLPISARGDQLLRPNPISGLPVLSWATGPGAKPKETAAFEDLIRPDATQPAAAFVGSAMHTGGDVWAIGRGTGAEPLRGFIENTRVFEIVRDAIGGAAR